MRTCTNVMVATVGCLCLTGAGWAFDGESMEDLRAEIDVLRSRLAAVESKNSDDWMTAYRADQIRSVVQDVLADADTRASLLQGGNAGYDGGFRISSGDGSFSLKANGQIQVRFNFNSQDDMASDNTKWGFENRRTKIKLGGHVVDPSWTYKVTGAFSNSSGTFGLEEAYIEKDLGNGQYLRMGQFKAPFLREELVSSSAQLAVERSLVNERFNQDFSQGIQWGTKHDTGHFMLMYHDGFGSRNTRAMDMNATDTEYAFTARYEHLASGNFKQFKSFTSKPGSEAGLLIGVAGHVSKEDFGLSGGAEDLETETVGWTADVSYEGDGFNIFAAATGRHRSWDMPGVMDRDEYGIVVQGGVYMNDETELFARYEWGDNDMVGYEDLNVITVGINHYYNSKVKATFDVGYGLDEVNGDWDSKSAGWRTDPSNEDGQLVVRSQLQLLF